MAKDFTPVVWDTDRALKRTARCNALLEGVPDEALCFSPRGRETDEVRLALAVLAGEYGAAAPLIDVLMEKGKIPEFTRLSEVTKHFAQVRERVNAMEREAWARVPRVDLSVFDRTTVIDPPLPDKHEVHLLGRYPTYSHFRERAAVVFNSGPEQALEYWGTSPLTATADAPYFRRLIGVAMRALAVQTNGRVQPYAFHQQDRPVLLLGRELMRVMRGCGEFSFILPHGAEPSTGPIHTLYGLNVYETVGLNVYETVGTMLYSFAVGVGGSVIYDSRPFVIEDMTR